MDLSGLTLTGADRVGFIHSISSNDVASLSTGQGCFSLILTAKGKIQYPLTVLVAPDRIDLGVEESLLEPLKSFLESSLVMEDVRIQDASRDWQFFNLSGSRLVEAMDQLNLRMPGKREFDWIEEKGVSVIRCSRTIEAGVDIRVAADQAAEWFEKLVFVAQGQDGGPVGAIARDILRIEAAQPKFGIDYSWEHFPQEAALENRAVSFTKGCFTGQEVVARIKTYGDVRRRLVGMVPAGPPPAPGDAVYLDGAEPPEPVGNVTSAARSIKYSKSVALAMVSTRAASPGGVLRVSSIDGAQARVVDIAGTGSSPWL